MHKKVQDTCISLVSRLKGITLYYRLVIFTPQDLNRDFSSLYYELANTTKEKENTICQHSTSSARYRQNEIYYDALILKAVKSYTDLQEEIRIFKENIAYFNKRNFLLTVGEGSPQFQNVSVNEDVTFFVQPVPSLMHQDCPKTVISMSALQFCYRVILKPVILLENGSVSARNITFEKGEYVLRIHSNQSVESIFTCLNIYASKLLGKDVEIENPLVLPSTTRSDTSAINRSFATQAVSLLLLWHILGFV